MKLICVLVIKRSNIKIAITFLQRTNIFAILYRYLRSRTFLSSIKWSSSTPEEQVKNKLDLNKFKDLIIKHVLKLNSHNLFLYILIKKNKFQRHKMEITIHNSPVVFQSDMVDQAPRMPGHIMTLVALQQRQLFIGQYILFRFLFAFVLTAVLQLFVTLQNFLSFC